MKLYFDTEARPSLVHAVDPRSAWVERRRDPLEAVCGDHIRYPQQRGIVRTEGGIDVVACDECRAILTAALGIEVE